jgi:hypothetical protein
MEHIIKYYPVGNADCTLIKLDNGKTIIVDCQILTDLTDGHGKQVMFDVKADLLNELKRDGTGSPFVDLFICTHPHDDHCKGFAGNFYHGDVADYDKVKNKDEIIIEELWITPRGLKNDLSEPAEDVRKEAKRRRKLYDDNADFKGTRGNYLRIIGYDNDKEFDSRYCYVPGETVSFVHGSSLSWLDIFIHAPFKEDVETSKKDDDKNATSIVVQFGFKVAGYTNYKCRVLMGGDAEHEIWQHILDNNTDEEKLQWNIFLAPHHCSWSFFNDSDNKKEIKPSAEAILNKQIGFVANVVASSNDIKNDGNNPPCYEAKQQYIKKLNAGSSHFLNTATHNKVGSIPQPIIFKINENGKTLKEITTVAGTLSISNPAPRAGR